MVSGRFLPEAFCLLSAVEVVGVSTGMVPRAARK